MNTNTARHRDSEYKYLDVLGVKGRFEGAIPVQNTSRHPALEPIDIITSDGKNNYYVVTVMRSLADVPSQASVAEQPNEHANTLARDCALARFKRYGVTAEDHIRGREFTVNDDHFQKGGDAATNKKIYVTVTRIPKNQEMRFIQENKHLLGSVDPKNPTMQRWKTSLEKNYPQLFKDISATLERPERGFRNPITGDVLKASAVYGFGYLQGMSTPSNNPSKTVTLSDMERDIGIKLAELISTCGEFKDFHFGPLEDTLVQNPYGTQAHSPKVINIYVDGNVASSPNDKIQTDYLWDSEAGRYKHIIPQTFAKEFNEMMLEQNLAAHGRLDNPIDGSGVERTVIKCIEVPQMIETPWYPPRDPKMFTRADNLCNTLIARINSRIDNPHHVFKEVIPLTTQHDIVDIRGRLNIPGTIEPRRAFFFERASVANTLDDVSAERKVMMRIDSLGLDKDPNVINPLEKERTSRDVGNAEVIRSGITGCLGSFESFVHTQINVSPSIQPLKVTVPRGNYFLCERLASVFRDNPHLDRNNELQILGEVTDVPATFFGPISHPYFFWRTHFRVIGVDRAIEEGRKECPVRIDTPSTPGSGMQFGGQYSIFVKGKEEATNYRYVIERDPDSVRMINYKGKQRLFWLWDTKKHRSIYADVIKAYDDQSNAGRIGFENNGIQARVNGIRPGRDNEGTGPSLFTIVCADEVNQETLIRAEGKMVLPRSRAYKRDFDPHAMFLRHHLGGKVRRNSENDDGFCFVTTRLVVDAEPTVPAGQIIQASKYASLERLKSNGFVGRYDQRMKDLTSAGDYSLVCASLGLSSDASKATIASTLDRQIQEAESSVATLKATAGATSVKLVVPTHRLNRLLALKANAHLN